MKTYRLAFIGFGNVGQGLAHIIRERGEELSAQFGVQPVIVAVSDLLKGAIYDPNGLDPAALLAAAAEGKPLDSLPAPHHGWDALKTITQTNADVIVEMSYTDLTTGEPAANHIRAALESGKHAVTTNKGPAALHYTELAALAEKNGVAFGVEGTVMSGTPSLHLGLDLLAAAEITCVQGIFNGTTNYILTQMGAGNSYAAALAEAQRLGYAEADPTGDVEGFDAAGKVVILANLLMGAHIGMQDVDRKGISHLTVEDITSAKAAGEKWKLIGKVEKAAGSIHASVQPTRLPLSHPLASVDGATNAITYTTDLLGDVTLIGPGAGRIETGYSLLVDLLHIHRMQKGVSYENVA
jgi:homoserine dehydrogenase